MEAARTALPSSRREIEPGFVMWGIPWLVMGSISSTRLYRNRFQRLQCARKSVRAAVRTFWKNHPGAIAAHRPFAPQCVDATLYKVHDRANKWGERCRNRQILGSFAADRLENVLTSTRAAESL